MTKLPPNTLTWFANALAGMVCADGVIDDDEIDYLKHALVFLNNQRKIDELCELVQKRNIPRLTQFRDVDRVTAFRLLINLCHMAINDHKFKKAEAEYILYAGGKLGFKQSFLKEILEWAKIKMDNRLTIERLGQRALQEEVEYT